MPARNSAYDLMRVIACLMIICMHAPMPAPNAMPLLLNATGYFMAPGLCLFFVLSGALLLPTTLAAGAFLRKRLTKILWPTLSFTAIYLAIKYLNGEQIRWLSTIASIPFSAQGHGVLWFMYTLAGLYLLTPIISPWLAKASRRELQFYLLLWAITLCYPLLQLLLNINATPTGPLYYFTGYAGYFLLGHYLHKYPDALPLKYLALPTAIAVIAPIACKLGHIQVDFYSIFWYLSIFVAILTATLFRALNRCKFTAIGGVNCNAS